jgi:hypothetical protein
MAYHPRNTAPMLKSQRCGAKTRSGKPCMSPAVGGRKRCRMHGGAEGSGAPRGNKNALEHGRFETQCENRVSCVVVQKIGLRPLANACQRLASFRNFSVPAKHLGSPPCDIAKPIWRFFCFRFRTRTPGPPPFLSPNSTSPDSNAPE